MMDAMSTSLRVEKGEEEEEEGASAEGRAGGLRVLRMPRSRVGDGQLAFALMHRHKSGKYVTPVPLDVLDSNEYAAIKNARCR